MDLAASEHWEVRTLGALLAIAGLPFTAMGRRRFWMTARKHIWPLTFPVAEVYRRTVLRHTRVIPIIGSFGKTTTTRAVAAVLDQPSKHLEWGLNSRGFLAEALLKAKRNRQYLAVEVGISRKGVMRRYARLLRPSFAVVTSIGTEHHTGLGSIERIAFEKAEMLRWLPADGAAILNGDDANVLGMGCETQAYVVTFGLDEGCDIRATGYRLEGATGATFDLHVEGETRRLHTRLIGRHQIYAILAAVAVAQATNQDLDEACRRLELLTPTDRRLVPVQLGDRTVILVDDYKSVQETAHAALETLEAFPSEKRIAVLGTIFEPTGDADEVYRGVGRHAGRVAEEVIFVGPNREFESLARGVRESGGSARHAESGIHEAARLVQDMLVPGTAVLLKGFGAQRLSRIGLRLAGSGVSCSRPTCSASLTWSCATCPFLEA